MILIFILDDNPEILEALGTLFSQAGYRVNTATTSKGMFDYLKYSVPDLFLIDVILGCEDGREICSLLKSNKDFQNKPIILMSGVIDYHLDNAGKPVFADDYIDKPFGNEDILDKIQMLLQDET
ncbi:two-component system response regulator [Pedobacter jeongneungensis]|uniref:response regulator n=1 Tax=Pedobacter jeongneungensis TaxID=947309 RepID=UPI000469F5A8|nr:response regulator [Pedobacter jeongneungensis]